MRTIVWTLKADADLAAMSRADARKIVEKVEQYALDPAALAANVKPLKGKSGVHRLRVGSYRVLMVESTVVTILRASRRDKAYK